MATICWKCGTEVPDGVQSCSKCGAAVSGTGGSASPFAAGASPFSSQSPSPFSPSSTPFSQGQSYTPPLPPPAAAPSAPPPPAAFTPVAAPPQPGFAPVQSGYAPPPPVYPPAAVGTSGARSGGGGSTAVKIVLIIVAIFVGIGILGASIVGYGIWRVTHAIRVANHGGNITIPGSGGGSFSVNSSQRFTASELGTDIYPGATTTQGGMRMSTPSGSWITAIYVTSDSKDQVLNFYKSKFGSDSALMETNDAAILTLKKGEKETVMVTISARPNEDNGKTKISITHTVSKT